MFLFVNLWHYLLRKKKNSILHASNSMGWHCSIRKKVLIVSVWTSYLLLPKTSIQTVALIFPALFSAVHPYWPASFRVTFLMIRVLLLTKQVPFLVQVTFGSGSPLSVHVILNKECKYTDIDSFLRPGLTFGGTKEKQKHFCLLITLHISVNNNLLWSVIFGCPGVLF